MFHSIETLSLGEPTVIEVVGGVRSTIIEIVLVWLFPALSVASAVTVCEPSVRLDAANDQLVVPVANENEPLSIFTRTLSRLVSLASRDLGKLPAARAV